MTPALTLFFVVEPPGYLYMACHLAASIRKFMPPEVRLIGYCPAHRWDEMDPNAVEVLRRLRCEIRPIEAEGRFDPFYPHGNKILAALAPKETDYAAFLDSDMMLMQPCSIQELVSPGQIGMVPSTSMRWAPQSVWKEIYGHFGMAVPEERILMTRDQRERVVPYFNAGLFVIDETFRTPQGQRFAEVWMDCAQSLDRHPTLENKRPYLDQMTLPVATLKAGMTWRIMPEKYNYSIGGILRGKPVSEETDVTILHYRKREVLGDAGLKGTADQYLAEQLGTRLVRWIFKVPPPPGIEPLPVVLPDAPEPVAEIAAPPAAQPDPSKAGLAAVTMVRGEHEALRRWIDYYAPLIGPENLYVLRHGADPETDRIAAGTNLVHLPDTGDDAGLDQRKSMTLSQFCSGLTLYYNWVLCTRVNEIVAPDPDTGLNLPEYLDRLSVDGDPPGVLAPVGIELLSAPAGGRFRINTKYAKPCLTRRRIRFSPDGSGSNIREVRLDPHLYLFSLTRPDAAPDRMDGAAPAATEIAFADLVDKMPSGLVQRDRNGPWQFEETRSPELYRLPERFGRLFQP